MKRISDKRRAAAEVPDEYTALVEMTAACEWCGRRMPLSDHHVAQQFRSQTLYDVRLLLRLCYGWADRCHETIHALPGETGRAIGLALVYHAGRGMNTQILWDIADRQHWPAQNLVDRWIDRLTRDRRAWQ